MDWPTLFDESGVQYMLLNTSIQLGSEEPDALPGPHGVDSCRCVQLPAKRGWKIRGVHGQHHPALQPALGQVSEYLIGALDFPRLIFPEVPASDHASPAGVGGGERPSQRQGGGLTFARHSPCRGGVPTECDRWAYISSGTWSLMGLSFRSQSSPMPVAS